MIFETKDEKINRLEKKIHDVERKLDYNMTRINETVTLLNEVILHLQAENRKLRDEKGFLVERHRKMLKRVPVPDLSTEIGRVLKPAADTIAENAQLLKLVAKEGFVEIKEPEPKRVYRTNPARALKEHIISGEKEDSGKSVDKLFEIVNELGRIRSDEAARRLGVHEIQIDEWARILEDHEMVQIKKTSAGKSELLKV